LVRSPVGQALQQGVRRARVRADRTLLEQQAPEPLEPRLLSDRRPAAKEREPEEEEEGNQDDREEREAATAPEHLAVGDGERERHREEEDRLEEVRETIRVLERMGRVRAEEPAAV